MSEDRASLIFIPYPVFSHLLAAIKMAKLLTDADHRFSIIILIMKLQSPDHNITSYINSSTDSRITFIHLHSPIIKAPPLGETPKGSIEAVVSAIKSPAKIAGLFIDIVCVSLIDAATELGTPAFVFFTCGAAILGLNFRLQDLMLGADRSLAAYEDSDAKVSVSTFVNPVPAKVWPSIVFQNGGAFFELSRKLREASGIVVNTFLELEPHAINALARDSESPAVYPVGPLLQEETKDGDPKRAEILRWLDEQPDSSVVFLCFGSHGCFNEDQVKEIAAALEQSGHRFLWSLRKPPANGTAGPVSEYENPGEVLTEGFLERTAAIGKVIGWAPQMAVLSHGAVGGFVSHCGWNSILESVWCGVPIATWPMYAEQQSNAFQLVKEMGIAIEIKMDYRKNTSIIVAADKIEKAIKQLMDPHNKIRVNIKELKEKSRSALMEGGSSKKFLNSLIQNVRNNLMY